jgi:hypothetical protein
MPTSLALGFVRGVQPLDGYRPRESDRTEQSSDVHA